MSRLSRLLLIIVPFLGILFSAPIASAWYPHHQGHYWRHHHRYHHYWRRHAYRPPYYYDRDWYAYRRPDRYERYSRVDPYYYYGYRGHRDD